MRLSGEFREVAYDQHLAIRLYRKRRHVPASVGMEVRIKTSIRIQARDVESLLRPNQSERAADQDATVGLDRERKHAAIRRGNERIVEGAVNFQTCEPAKEGSTLPSGLRRAK